MARKNDWEKRCAVLYQVIGALSGYSGTFGEKDIDDALDVACGEGDPDALLPWPKNLERFNELEKLTESNLPRKELQ